MISQDLHQLAPVVRSYGYSHDDPGLLYRVADCLRAAAEAIRSLQEAAYPDILASPGSDLRFCHVRLHVIACALVGLGIDKDNEGLRPGRELDVVYWCDPQIRAIADQVGEIERRPVSIAGRPVDDIPGVVSLETWRQQRGRRGRRPGGGGTAA